MSTTILYRTFKGDKPALVNVNRASGIVQKDFGPDGVSIMATYLNDRDGPHVLTLASGLTPTAADTVVKIIFDAIKFKRPAIEMADVVKTAEQIDWYQAAGVCTEEVEAS